jgi:glycine betaine/choline ABC-type transport system substrate-binding protein
MFVTQKSVADEAGPDFEETILKVQEGLSLEVMQELDARVELEKETPKQVAGDYLKESGYTG